MNHKSKVTAFEGPVWVDSSLFSILMMIFNRSPLTMSFSMTNIFRVIFRIFTFAHAILSTYFLLFRDESMGRVNYLNLLIDLNLCTCCWWKSQFFSDFYYCAYHRPIEMLRYQLFKYDCGQTILYFLFVRSTWWWCGAENETSEMRERSRKFAERKNEKKIRLTFVFFFISRT